MSDDAELTYYAVQRGLVEGDLVGAAARALTPALSRGAGEGAVRAAREMRA